MSFPPWGRRALTQLWSCSRMPGQRTVAPTVSLAVKPSSRDVWGREPGRSVQITVAVSGLGVLLRSAGVGGAPVRGFRRPQARVCHMESCATTDYLVLN